jgi:hypothetical protein
MGPGAGLDMCGKSRPTRIRSPDLPARSESLYRLSYPDSKYTAYKTIILPFAVYGRKPWRNRYVTSRVKIVSLQTNGNNKLEDSLNKRDLALVDNYKVSHFSDNFRIHV